MNTVKNPCANTTIMNVITEWGWSCVAAQAERLRKVKYEYRNSSHFYVPFAVETSGVLGEERS